MVEEQKDFLDQKNDLASDQHSKKVGFVLSSHDTPNQNSEKGIQQQEAMVKKPQSSIYNSMKRKTYSKYDLVKVKVILEDHFYIFSRFLISRILTLIKVKEKDSIKVTLEVKKMLIESNQLEITQGALEDYLFEILSKFGYQENFVKRYRMISTFYQKRLPFIIMISGTECMGKSTLVTQLGERINISNIVQTSIVQKVMMGLQSLMQANQNSKHQENSDHDQEQSEEDIIKQYTKMCRHVRKGCNFDIQKCFIDGKPLIIEGSQIEPNLFVRQIEQEDGQQKLEILTPDPENEEEASLENEAIKKMRKQMQNIDQKGAMIIPFLLTISPQSHALCLESKIAQEFSQKSDKVKILSNFFRIFPRTLRIM